jgi:DNA-binding transcriptional LysR family regulator
VHIQTREINTREQIAPLNEGALDLGLMRNTQLPDTLAWQVILHEPLMAMIPLDHPLASRPAVSLAELAKEPFVFFDPQVGTGLYDDILGLMRRYDLAPVITQEVGEAMTIIGLVAAGLGSLFFRPPLNGYNCAKCAGFPSPKRMPFPRCGWSGQNIVNRATPRSASNSS